MKTNLLLSVFCFIIFYTPISLHAQQKSLDEVNDKIEELEQLKAGNESLIKGYKELLNFNFK